MDKQLYKKIISKKEFSQLLKKDVELTFSHFDKEHLIDEEKVKKTRDLLRKVYFAFGSLKLLDKKIVDKKSVEEILKKHISTRERFDYSGVLYEKLLKGFGDVSIIDLGAGINGLSYGDFVAPLLGIPSQKCYQSALRADKQLSRKVAYLKKINYIGIEAVGQLVELMNYYFKKNKIKNAKAIHGSLFGLKKVREIIKKTKKPRVVFLFKTVDCLEMMERDYSKKLLRETIPLVEKVVVSFATRSLIKKTKFKVKRFWFENFLKEEGFKILDDFELGGERYVVFCKG